MTYKLEHICIWTAVVVKFTSTMEAAAAAKVYGHRGGGASHGYLAEIGELLSRPVEFTMICTWDFVDLLVHIENTFI